MFLTARLGQGLGLSSDTPATAMLASRPSPPADSSRTSSGEDIFIRTVISAQDNLGILSELSPGTSCFTTIGGNVFMP